MVKLPQPDANHLKAAQGWLELGNHLEANTELENITPRNRQHPLVLEIRWQIYAKEKKWEICADIGQAMVKAAMDLPEGWIHRSHALHKLKRTREAADLLQPAAERFPGEWLIRYNLACYAARLGNQKQALTWLKSAFDLADDPTAVKLMALNERDFGEPFWAETGDV